MSGFDLAIDQSSLVAFLLATARTAGFVMVTPPFNNRSVPAQARVGLIIGLSFALGGALRASAPSLDSDLLLPDIVLQTATGLALGFLVLTAVSAVEAVGDLLDTVGGFSVSTALDPMNLVQTSVMGRLHQITAAALLFVTDGHLMIIQGLSRSVALMPAGLSSWNDLVRDAAAAVDTLMLSALQIAAPVVAVMLVTDLALGLLTRAAPALNAFALSYPMKIFLTLLVAGLVLARLPDALENLVSNAVLTVLRLVTQLATPG